MAVGGTRAQVRYFKKTMETRGYFKALNRLTLYGPFNEPDAVAAADACWSEIRSLLKKVDRSVSLSWTESDLRAFNGAPAGSWTPVNGVTAQLSRLALGAAERTGGAFNPATARLTDVWGFSPRTFSTAYEPSRPYDRPRLPNGAFPPPDPADVAAAVEACGLDGLALERRGAKYGLLKPRSELCLDFGGVAKGWVADAALSIARQHGFDHAAYSCESSIALARSASELALRRGSADHTLYLTHPRPKGRTPNYLQVSVHDRAIGTSGDYGRCYELDGILYAHIIDPRTGLPLNVVPGHLDGTCTRQRGLCTVTLLGPDAGNADALATALCLMGERSAREFYRDCLAAEGWDLVAVAYDTDRPEELRLITSLPADSYRVLDHRLEVEAIRGR